MRSGSSLSTPKVSVKIPNALSKTRQKASKSKSLLRIILEFILFSAWLVMTGVGGYFVGHTHLQQECPPLPQVEVIEVKHDCIHEEELGVGTAVGADINTDGFTLNELHRQWTCSHAESNFTQANARIIPKDHTLGKTKWKTILSVEPKKFFDKYLTQYPGDVRSVQPVVVFSHKPLNNFEELSDVCKVVDIAIVPDTPGVCVAVTETYHDVASYHMLHADRQTDGTYALTANSLEGRELPNEQNYVAARALLLEFFQHVKYVEEAVNKCPKYSQNKVTVGVLIEDEGELELFQNSLQFSYKAGINKNKFCVFTTSNDISNALRGSGLKIINLNKISDVGTHGDSNVGIDNRRFFLQAWLAFACSNALIKMMWQSPGTVWFDRPDNIVNVSPIVETLWSYKGRKDRRGAPFYTSFDFFVPTGHERPVHLMHEIILHFDLVLAWKSLDAVTSYRLSENNARYGTTTYMLPPYKVLHTELMNHDPVKIIDAVTTTTQQRPMVIVFPHEGRSTSVTKELLQKCNLWLLK